MESAYCAACDWPEQQADSNCLHQHEGEVALSLQSYHALARSTGQFQAQRHLPGMQWAGAAGRHKLLISAAQTWRLGSAWVPNVLVP